MEMNKRCGGGRPPSNKYGCPWLMISSGASEQQIVYNILEHGYYKTNIVPDTFGEFPISTNQHGWLLIQGERPIYYGKDGDGDEEDDVDAHDDGEEEDSDGGEEDINNGAEEEEEELEDDVLGGAAVAAEELRDDEDRVDCFLWNINSLEKIPIPDYKPGCGDTKCYYDHCLLSSSPNQQSNDDDCFIYLFKDKSIFFGPLLSHHTQLSHCVVFDVEVGGAIMAENNSNVIYLLRMCGEVVVVAKPAYREGCWCLDLTTYRVDHPIQRPLGLGKFRFYIIPYQGQLINVTMSYYGCYGVSGFLVHRFNFDHNSWDPLDDIGQTAIFLCPHLDFDMEIGAGFRCEVSNEDAKQGIKPNSIYFTYCSQKFIYIFDMEYQTISYFSPCPMVNNCNFQWVMF